jgi:hypothetical protein
MIYLRAITLYPYGAGWLLQNSLAIPPVIYGANTQDLVLYGSCVGICAINRIRILSGTYLYNKASRCKLTPSRSRILNILSKFGIISVFLRQRLIEIGLILPFIGVYFVLK